MPKIGSSKARGGEFWIIQHQKYNIHIQIFGGQSSLPKNSR